MVVALVFFRLVVRSMEPMDLCDGKPSENCEDG